MVERRRRTYFGGEVLERPVDLGLISRRNDFVFLGHGTEVGQEEVAAFADEDVLRLQIAMNKMHGVVEVIHCRGNLGFRGSGRVHLRHIETN